MKTKNNLYKIIKVNFYKDKRGVLIPFEEKGSGKDPLPIKIKRVFILRDLAKNLERGNHALRTTNQIIFVLNGSCDLELDNGFIKKKIRINDFRKGILVYPMVWRVLKNFTKNTLIMVICDKEYKERDYIRDYESFIQQIRRRV